MENYDTERYLYTVYPKRPIKNLNELVPILRVPKTLSLNKEEVLKCFSYGSVYRRFSNEGIIEKVTKYDVDRVHRPNYISIDQWKVIMGEAKDVDNLAVNGATPVEVKKEEVATPEPVVEAEPVKEEVVTEEPQVEEEAPVVEETVEEVATPVEEEVVEETVVEEIPATEEVETKTEETVEEVATPVEEVVEEATEETVEAEDELTEDTEVEFEGADEDEEETVEEIVEEAKPQQPVNINYNKKKKHH